jgi:beta-lactamase superfamily II metal-dependent hydrolase
VTLEFISPAKDAAFAADNDWSLVARMVPRGGAPDKETPVLFCGDIEGPAMEGIMAAHPGLHPRVMEAPHHGSAKQAGIQFVSELNPEIVVQSTGPQRANDARWIKVREGRVWYTTCLNGASWVEVRRDGSVKSGPMGGGE